MSDTKRLRAIDLIPDRSGRTANTHVPVDASPAVTFDDAIEAVEYLDEIRRERDSARAANEGWKRAFSALHDTLEQIAAGHQPPESIGPDDWEAAYRGLQKIAANALHVTEEA